MILSLPRLRRAAAVVVATGALVTASPVASPAAAATAPPVSASGAFMLNNATGAALYSKGADTKRQMASTTKIMTALVVLTTPNVDLNRRITVKQAYPDYVNSVGASSAYLYVGDRLTVTGMLNAMLAPSGCDAAYALADTFGTGTTMAARKASFIAKMNAKAAALGLTNTKFDSFDGNSPTGNNYTTPRDLAKLAAYTLKNYTFSTIVKSPSGKASAIASNGRTRSYTWDQSNLLVRPKPAGYAYPGAIGVKTGTNTPAGKCLVFAATRNGKTVVGVVLNDENRYVDSMKMLDYAFGTTAARMAATQPIPDVLD